MPNFNKAILIGHLVKEPEMRTTPSGTSVANFTIATNRKYKEQEETLFMDCVAFGKLGDVIGNYTFKGAAILVEGRLRQERWEKDGQKFSKIKLIAEQIQLLSSRQGNGQQDNQSEQFTEDDLPF